MHKKRKLSKECRRKMSEAKMGHKGYWLGKKRDKKTIEKTRNKLKGKSQGPMSLDHKNKIGLANSKALKGRKWSKEERINRVKAFPRGKEHWNWKGGIASQNSIIRNSIEYKAWRLDVYQRDYFTCQYPGCGYKGKNIEAHHIKAFHKYPELIYDVDNGITLCKKCHLLIRNKEKEFEDIFARIIKIIYN